MKSILIVITASSTQNLTVLPTVKAELQITENAQDTQLSTWIRQASAMIATFCNRVLAAETVTETFRNQICLDEIVLTRFPVISVTSVMENGILLVAAEFEVDKKSGIVWRISNDQRVSWPSGKIVFDYSGGYVLIKGLPEDIEMACIKTVKSMASQHGRDPMAKRIEIPDVRTIDYWVGPVGEGGALSDDVQSILQPYRCIRI